MVISKGTIAVRQRMVVSGENQSDRNTDGEKSQDYAEGHDEAV
jgi:hypothetical protein